MPIRTTFVQSVYPHARFPQRFVVDLPFGLRLYTTHQGRAALCERAGKIGKAVRIATMDGRFGEEIVSVELAQESTT